MAVITRLREIRAWYAYKKLFCHQATIAWLYEEAYGSLPPLELIYDAQPFMRSLIPSGVALQQSTWSHSSAGLKQKATGALVPPGSVIIFCSTQAAGDASHSCIANSTQEVTGYNQTDWFTSAGVDGGFSRHKTKHIAWSDKHHSTRFNRLYRLVAVFESDAVQAVKNHYAAPA